LADETPDPKVYKQLKELTMPKSAFDKDLITTEGGTLINPKMVFNEAEKPFKLISNNAVPSFNQAKALKNLFSQNNLKLLINRVYTYSEVNNKLVIKLFERF